jgi:hypothetical protein
MPFDAYAVEIAPAGIFIRHKLYDVQKKDPTAYSVYDTDGRDHEWWPLTVSHATVN